MVWLADTGVLRLGRELQRAGRLAARPGVAFPRAWRRGSPSLRQPRPPSRPGAPLPPLRVRLAPADLSSSSNAPVRRQGQCRELLVRDFPITLHGASDEDGLPVGAAPQLPSLRLEFPPEHAAALSHACAFTIRPPHTLSTERHSSSLRSDTSAGSAAHAASAVLHLEFAPLRPLRATVQALVAHPSGGLWRFLIDLAADPADPDDTINIVSSMNKTASVSFHLTNQFDKPASFSAIILPEVQTAFKARPTTGTLKPYGSDGTRFIIDFTPSEYGKNYSAQLVIDTDDMQWIYELRGSFPVYKPPETGSLPVHVETHLSRDVEENLSVYRPARNFAQLNMQAVKKPGARQNKF